MGHHLVSEFITEDFRASVQEVLDRALQGEETANFEFPLITKDGRSRVEVLLNATSRRDLEGRVTGMVGIGQDITARIAQEQEYVRLIDTANAPIFGVDTKGKVWNEWVPWRFPASLRNANSVYGLIGPPSPFPSHTPLLLR